MEPLKERYNTSYLTTLADALVAAWSPFPRASFLARVLADGWDELELKQRMTRIVESLHADLPDDYRQALAVIQAAAPAFGGFEGMFFPEFVATHGLHDWEASLPALADLTRWSSSEFAVRPFILADPERMMAHMREWAEHDNYHVRRLASEGCRPRLPWAPALPAFKRDPSPILPILERLQADPEDYVRRSVANNLNDISKDHPQLLLSIARRWLGRQAHTDWIVKHACRSLLKAGDREALALFDLGLPRGVTLTELQVESDPVRIGDHLVFTFRLELAEAAKLRVEYAIDYLKANDKYGRKIFKISEKDVSAGAGGFRRRQSFADMTTRKHRPGRHRLAIIVNGEELGATDFLVAQA